MVRKEIMNFCVFLLSLKGQFPGFAYGGVKGRILCCGCCAALTATGFFWEQGSQQALGKRGTELCFAVLQERTFCWGSRVYASSL